MAALTVKAYAKINLGLEVISRRDDGYHELVTVLQTVSLFDEIAVASGDVLTLRCDSKGMIGERNLVWRAADLLQKESGTEQGATIDLIKTIPIAAGLGGGSSDAATTLRSLNDLWKLDLDASRLVELASQLGSDVPFFLQGGTQLGTGRGELLDPLPTPEGQWFVIVSPDIRVPGKTPGLYDRLGRDDFTDGSTTAKLAEALRSGEAITDDHMVNGFEHIADDAFPGLDHHRNAMLKAGAERVHLSGSGPSLFSLVKSESAGVALWRRLGGLGFHGIVVQTVTSEEQN
jgi:4-diphosphocytidyl-2-C-methyl-D-erythritol kinase